MVPYTNSRPNIDPGVTNHAMPTRDLLNEGQQAAADKFFEFLFSDKKEFELRGAGGVGKTFVMSYLIDRILPQYHEACALMGIDPIYNEVAMTATTNKAADVLGFATKRPTSTIYSFLGIRPIMNYETRTTKLVRKSGTVTRSNILVFIDECSMIDTALYAEIHALLDNSCKIVYVGDKSQLAPVNERISPVYRQQGMPYAELTKNERASAQPALLAINQQLRETVQTGVFKPIQAVPGVIDVLDGSEVEQIVQKLFHKSTFANRILCYTNAQTLAYNNYIRGLRNLPAGITEGEVLVCNYGVQHPKGMLSPETELEILKIGPVTRWESKCKQAFLDIQYASVVTSFGTVIHKLPVAVDPQDRINTIKFLKKNGDVKDEIFLSDEVADLRQRDAGTVYKAQGSTYDTVVVDLDDISKCHNRDTVARMLYVAFSRAKSRIVLHGQLPAKYGSLIE